MVRLERLNCLNCLNCLNRRLEYRFYAYGNFATVCSFKVTDERLLRSTYYAERKDKWLDHAKIKELIKYPEYLPNKPDIELDDSEKHYLRLLSESVAYGEHGWFEVVDSV